MLKKRITKFSILILIVLAVIISLGTIVNASETLLAGGLYRTFYCLNYNVPYPLWDDNCYVTSNSVDTNWVPQNNYYAYLFALGGGCGQGSVGDLGLNEYIFALNGSSTSDTYTKETQKALAYQAYMMQKPETPVTRLKAETTEQAKAETEKFVNLKVNNSNKIIGPFSVVFTKAEYNENYYGEITAINVSNGSGLNQNATTVYKDATGTSAYDSLAEIGSGDNFYINIGSGSLSAEEYAISITYNNTEYNGTLKNYSECSASYYGLKCVHDSEIPVYAYIYDAENGKYVYYGQSGSTTVNCSCYQNDSGWYAYPLSGGGYIYSTQDPFTARRRTSCSSQKTVPTCSGQIKSGYIVEYYDENGHFEYDEPRLSYVSCNQGLTVNHNASSVTTQNIVQGMNLSKDTSKNVVTRTFKVVPPIRLKLWKTDNSTTMDKLNSLPGISFDITATQNYKSLVVETKSLKTDENGEISAKIQPEDISDITVLITEKDILTGYFRYETAITITYTFDSELCCWVKSGTNIPDVRTAYSPSDQKVTVTNTESENISISTEGEAIVNVNVQNTAKIEKLTILKIDNVEGKKLEGAEFKITLENAKIDGKTEVTSKTNSDGELVLENIEIIDANESVKITIKETTVPPETTEYHYKLISDEIVLEITHSPGGLGAALNKGNNTEKIELDDIEAGEFVITITAEDIRLIDLSGQVWEDGQTGIKPVNTPDGLISNDEKFMKDVKVSLYGPDGQVTKDAYGKEIGTDGYIITDVNGGYEFIDIPQLKSGTYYIQFTYDGINYIRTIDGDSDADEVDRKTFNNRFSTITKGQSNDGTQLEYTYASNTSILETSADGVAHKDGVVLDEFAMNAETDGYNTTTSDIDLGLVKRGVDLALVTDIDHADVSINGKKTTYTYGDILNDGNHINIGGNDTGNVVYNLNLYTSDYNYRITDYATATETATTSSTKMQTGFINSGYKDISTASTTNSLEILVTYAVVLNNQSTPNATVNEVLYHFDDKYSFVRAFDASDSTLTTSVSGNTVTVIPSATLTDGGNTTIYLQFKVLEETSTKNLKTGDFTNSAEISSYSTTDGLIDIDSQPGNLKVNGHEDDSDDAGGLRISIGETRTVSGYVFEDMKTETTNEYKHGNGVYSTDNEDSLVNGVIVQLIEIREVNGVQLEYIWQQAMTGSKDVQALTSDGTKVTSYSVENSNGEYTFNGFVPGNYIIRFIYGDGTTQSKALNEHIIDGQNYQSTIDMGYYKYYLNTSDYGNENSSMARDNEARRLEVMAYALGTTATYDNLKAMTSPDVLKNTWMCAETSLLSVNVDEEEDSGEHEHQDENSTKVTGTKELITTWKIPFGVQERPKIEVTLEKHITGVKINTSGNESITYTIDSVNGDLVTLKEPEGGITGTNVSCTAQQVSRIGHPFQLWRIGISDLTKLVNSTVEITYTYTINTQGSEIDYLSSELVGIYNDKNKDYVTNLNDISKAVKDNIRSGSYTTGKYLGNTYYTGQSATNTSLVAINLTIEDYLKTKYAVSRGNFETSGTSEKSTYNAYQTENDPAKSNLTTKESVNILQASKTLKLGEKNEDLKLTVSANLNSSGEQNIPSYIAQIVKCSTANGTIDMSSKYGNLGDVVYSNYQYYTLNSITSEEDAFWAEGLVIAGTEGEDRSADSDYTTIITIILAIAIVGVGTVLIKKFAIKK